MANTIYRHDKYGLWAPKDPGSRLDYGFNWVDRLQPLETIASSVWSAETSGIAVSSTYVSNINFLVFGGYFRWDLLDTELDPHQSKPTIRSPIPF